MKSIRLRSEKISRKPSMKKKLMNILKASDHRVPKLNKRVTRLYSVIKKKYISEIRNQSYLI